MDAFVAGCHMQGFWAEGLTPGTIALTDTVGNAGDLTTYTYAATDIGTEHPTRYIVVGTHGDGATDWLRVTLDDEPLMKAHQSEFVSNNSVVFYFGHYPTGTSVEVEIVGNAASARNIAGIWAVYNLVEAGVVDTATSSADPSSLDVLLRPGGVGIAVSYNEQAAASITWSGFIEDFESGSVDSRELSGASLAAGGDTGTIPVSGNWSATTDVVSAAITLASVVPPQLLRAGVATSTGATIDTPAIAGDLMILMDIATGIKSAPTNVVPTGFTSIDTATSSTTRQTLSYKIADGTEGSITGMDGNASDSKTLVCFRKTSGAIGSVSLSAVNTGASPQTVSATDGSAPILIMGTGDLSPEDNDNFIPYKVYHSGDTIADVTCSSAGFVALRSFYLEIN